LALAAFGFACSDAGPSNSSSATPTSDPIIDAGAGGPAVAPSSDAAAVDDDPTVRATLATLVWSTNAAPPADISNRYADDDSAAKLGQKLFNDSRFSGPLLDSVNDGIPGTLGVQGDTGKVACASCHMPTTKSFVDSRSPRGQLSLASGWTHRRTPPLLDVAQVTFLTWDGRRDTLYSVVFNPIESALEFNSSRLFVAQQVRALYRAEYEAVFGPMPDSLTQYAPLAPADAGCSLMPSDPVKDRCAKPGSDDPDVTRVVVNFGKAVAAYLRRLSCGPSRFDAWMGGDASALNADEAAGAKLFARSGCPRCHAGAYLTDQRFHNVGHAGDLIPFTGVDTRGDVGASAGLAQLREDPLNSGGVYSDGNDHRLDSVPQDLSTLTGAFRTRSLRCLSDRPSFMHDGDFRSLYDVVRFFAKGGEPGNVGHGELTPLDLTSTERDQLVAFLRALDGPGPTADLVAAPDLPKAP
jgi:cytochrome c peroxidase